MERKITITASSSTSIKADVIEFDITLLSLNKDYQKSYSDLTHQLNQLQNDLVNLKEEFIKTKQRALDRENELRAHINNLLLKYRTRCISHDWFSLEGRSLTRSESFGFLFNDKFLTVIFLSSNSDTIFDVNSSNDKNF